MAKWYFSYNNDQIGLFDDIEAAQRARQNPEGYAWREGFTEWQRPRAVKSESGRAPFWAAWEIYWTVIIGEGRIRN